LFRSDFIITSASICSVSDIESRKRYSGVGDPSCISPKIGSAFLTSPSAFDLAEAFPT
jgi:hypothetical protein